MTTLLHLNVRCSMNEDHYHGLKETYKFLSHLIDPKRYPAIPKKIRDNARKCLKDWPEERFFKEAVDSVGFFNPR